MKEKIKALERRVRDLERKGERRKGERWKIKGEGRSYGGEN